MSKTWNHSVWACAAAVGGVALWTGAARADDDCYYGTGYTNRHVYVDPVPVYGPQTTVVYNRSPYVSYTRTYSAPVVTYVERPVVYRHRYHHPYRYSYLHGGLHHYRSHRPHGWSFGIGGSYGHHRHYGHHGHYRGRHWRH